MTVDEEGLVSEPEHLEIPLPDLTAPGHVVAPQLIGCILQVGDVAVRLVEVEAYEGAEDPASHAFNGPTERNKTMFGPAGHLYVYQMHGHACCNVVCGPEGEAQAVLLRAGEVMSGWDEARERRGQKRSTGAQLVRDAWLARGPGNLTRALGITIGDDGADLLGGDGRIRLLPALASVAVTAGPRVHVSKAWDIPWRFTDPLSPAVSAYKPHMNARAGLREDAAEE